VAHGCRPRAAQSERNERGFLDTFRMSVDNLPL
jgi:hypothetical protein